MRSKLHGANPVKYSKRVLLNIDLCILAVACDHKVPQEGVDVEKIIEEYRTKARLVQWTGCQAPGMKGKKKIRCHSIVLFLKKLPSDI